MDNTHCYSILLGNNVKETYTRYTRYFDNDIFLFCSIYCYIVLIEPFILNKHLIKYTFCISIIQAYTTVYKMYYHCYFLAQSIITFTPCPDLAISKASRVCSNVKRCVTSGFTLILPQDIISIAVCQLEV